MSAACYPARKEHAPYYTVICGLGPAVQYFSTLSHKRYDFREKNVEHTTAFWLSLTTFVWNISRCKKNSAKYFHVLILNLGSTAGLDFFFSSEKNNLLYSSVSETQNLQLAQQATTRTKLPTPIDK